MANTMSAEVPKATMTRYCVGLHVRGALRWPKSRLSGMLRHLDGREMTPAEAREALMDELVQGREVLPIGECDLWDYKTGCPGHPYDEGEG